MDFTNGFGYFMLSVWIVLGIGMIAGFIKGVITLYKNKKGYNHVAGVLEEKVAINYNGTYIVLEEQQYLQYWKNMTRDEKRSMADSEKKMHRQGKIKQKIEVGEIRLIKQKKKRPSISGKNLKVIR